MSEFTPLEIEIRRRIVAAGPMPVGEYMALCLCDPTHGYYVTRDPLGQRGDFVTAPEVSQMFGELIGLWLAAMWKQMGEPERLRLIELGPGRGTLMKDALRAAKVMPGFREAVLLHLIEISPALRAVQERTLAELPVPLAWHKTCRDVPAGAVIVVANEFFDALPVNQAIKTERGWHERRVEIGADGRLAFTMAPEPMAHFAGVLPQSVRAAPPGAIFEWRSGAMAMEMGRHIGREGGVALVIDYGHAQSATGETLQAIDQHAYADPLSRPGEIDLTAHVDFQALAKAVESMGVEGFGPISQAELLRRLGIEARAASLKARAAPAVAADIDAALARLTGEGRTGMGALFKAAAFAHPSVGVPPGFEGFRA